MQTLKSVQNNQLEILIKSIINYYESREYLNIVNVYKDLTHIDNYDFWSVLYFNNIVEVYFLVFVSFVILKNFERALEVLLDLESLHLKQKKYYVSFVRILRLKDFTLITQKEALEIVSFLNETLKIFNKQSRLRFYNNIAYAYHRNKQYDKAILYYDKALLYKQENIQILTGKAESLYEFYAHSITSNKEVLDTFNSIIHKLSSFKSSTDCYLSLGQLHYYIEEYDKALNFLNLALKYSNKKQNENSNSTNDENSNSTNEIYAYDWISRIAYKRKQYNTATIFYEKIIDALIKDNNDGVDIETIHPKPDLHDMVKYLNETKNLIVQRDIHYINKTIWGGILAGVILEAFEIYSSTKSYHLPLIMVLIVIVVTIIYVNIYK